MHFYQIKIKQLARAQSPTVTKTKSRNNFRGSLTQSYYL